MARRKRIARGQRVKVTAAEWEWLTGEMQSDANPFERLKLYAVGLDRRPAPIERVRAIWGEWRDRALRAWTDRNPGTRPTAWWLFEAPLTAFQVLGESTDTSGLPVAIVESEAAWLDRHGLLTAGERKRLTEEAWEPAPDWHLAANIIAQRVACAAVPSNVIVMEKASAR